MTENKELYKLIEGCRKNKYRYQKKLYDKFSPLFYAICLRYTKNTANAEDVLQESFVKIYSKINTFKDEGSFEGWMKRIVVNTCLIHLRKKNLLDLTDEESDLDSPNEEDEEIDYKISYDVLIKNIQMLPTGYQTVFNMYVIEEYTHAQISELLNISVGTSKSQLARAKKQLRDQLKSYL